jgi:hypothetical protein
LKTLSQKIGLVEWLKVKVLSSRPITTKKKIKKRKAIAYDLSETKNSFFPPLILLLFYNDN